MTKYQREIAEFVPVEDVVEDDVIWVQQDNDWMRVDRIETDNPFADGPMLFRGDGSLAEFRDGDRVPRRVD